MTNPELVFIHTDASPATFLNAGPSAAGGKDACGRRIPSRGCGRATTSTGGGPVPAGALAG